MLNSDYKEQAIRDLQNINDEYVKVLRKTIFNMDSLQSTRQLVAIRTIKNAENYIIRIANRPKNFDVKLGDVKIRYTDYLDKIQKIKRENEEKQEEIMRLCALGSIGVNTLPYTTTASVAMTLGKKSITTAMSSLSGIGTISPVLSWLGGSSATLASSGGLLAGSSLIKSTIAGPIGVAIGGASMIAALMSINLSNKEIASKAEKSIKTIKNEIERIKEIDIKVSLLNKETKELSNSISKKLLEVTRIRKKDYQAFSEEELEEITILFNSLEVLSKKIGEVIKGE